MKTGTTGGGAQRRRRDDLRKTVRWLGVLLPLVLSYPLLPVQKTWAWFRPRVLGQALLWLVLAAVLLIRRDWRGAAQITSMYVIVDAWLTYARRADRVAGKPGAV